MEKFTFVDWLVAISFSLALIAIGIGLRVIVFGKYQTKENGRHSLVPSISQPPSVGQ